jgi:hypothetical protein
MQPPARATCTCGAYRCPSAVGGEVPPASRRSTWTTAPVERELQIIPGYDYALEVTPTASGDFRIICNEFCGIGHHTMVGRVIVLDQRGERVSDNSNARLTNAPGGTTGAQP